MNIADINSQFSKDSEPKDEQLIALLAAAYKGQILCRRAIVNMECIAPFSEYRPVVGVAYREYFVSQMQNSAPPALYVYFLGNKLIMSDDYQAYELYKELGLAHANCVVIGDFAQKDGVSYIGEAFVLPLPGGEVVTEA